MVISHCQFCQKEIKFYKPRKFCSNECVKSYGEKRRTLLCVQCNKTYVLKKGEGQKCENTFCSKECFRVYYSGWNNHAYKGVKEERNCLYCTAKFTITSTKDKSKKYCSKICKMESTKASKLVDAICYFCKSKFIAKKKYGGSNKFCSRKCADNNHSKEMKGGLNSNYVHGEADYAYGKGWTLKNKEEIRIRDGYICQLCSLKQNDCNEKLHVHHIDFNKHNHSQDNLISLCRNCHMGMHGKYTRDLWKEKLLKILDAKKKFQNMSTICE